MLFVRYAPTHEIVISKFSSIAIFLNNLMAFMTTLESKIIYDKIIIILAINPLKINIPNIARTIPNTSLIISYLSSLLFFVFKSTSLKSGSTSWAIFSINSLMPVFLSVTTVTVNLL